MLDDLSDAQIDQLIGEHWREIKGLMKEKRRRQVLNTNEEPLDTGYRDGWTAG